jgi:hypothetical protein
MKAEEFSERTIELAGWPVRVTTYKVGEKYHAKVDNVSPGAAVSRDEGDSKDAAEAAAISKAEERLKNTRRMPVE